jgi:hypothetical protein
MQIIANKEFRYPYNGPVRKTGETFEAINSDADTLIATGLAQRAKRKYMRRDMTAEDSKSE